MDETICYLLDSWANLYNNTVANDHLDISKVTEWDLCSYVKYPSVLMSLLLTDENLFENLPPVEDAVEVLTELNKFYNIRIVTDASGSITVLYGKLKWIKKHLPFVDTKRDVFFTSNKNAIKGDIIIDDGPYILESDDQGKILMDRRYNRTPIYHSGVIRVKTWKEIYELLQEDV